MSQKLAPEMIGPLWPFRRTARAIEGHFSEILKVIEEYLSNATQLVADLSKTAKELEWLHPFTPYVMREIQQAQKDAHCRVHWVVPTPGDESVWQVIEAHDARSTIPGLRSHEVNAFDRTCTCFGRAKSG